MLQKDFIRDGEALLPTRQLVACGAPRPGRRSGVPLLRPQSPVF